MALSGDALIGQVRLAMRSTGEQAVASGANKVAGSMNNVRLKLASASEMAQKARANLSLIGGLVGGTISSGVQNLLRPDRSEQDTGAGEFAAGVVPGIGGITGAMAAGKIGAALGTVVGPIGTAVGFIAGSILGSLAGPMLGDAIDFIGTEILGAQTARERAFNEAIEKKTKELKFAGINKEQIREMVAREIQEQEMQQSLKAGITTGEHVNVLINEEFNRRRESFWSSVWDRFTDLPSATADIFHPSSDFETRLRNEIWEQYGPALEAVRHAQARSLSETTNAMAEMYRY